MERERNVAVVLAAGRGKRMNAAVHKQYLLLNGKQILYYSLKTLEDCPFMDEVILVTGKDDMDYCRKEIVERYGLSKVKKIVPGGVERYHSVYEGLKAVGEDCTYVYIHDGARPFLDQEILERARREVHRSQACVVGMPVKDTIKISDGDGTAVDTPRRELVWMIQTPQVFSFKIIFEAYRKIFLGNTVDVTDDAMVLEVAEGRSVRLVEGSYRNIKITTPEDLIIAEAFLAIKK